MAHKNIFQFDGGQPNNDTSSPSKRRVEGYILPIYITERDRAVAMNRKYEREIRRLKMELEHAKLHARNENMTHTV